MKKTRAFRILSLIIIMSLLLIAIPATPIAAATIAVTPASGAAGTQVTLIGAGFSPAIQYEIYLGSTPLGDIVYPDSTGTINYTFQIPTGTAAGYYEVKLYSCGGNPVSPCTLSAGVTNTTYFTVTAGSSSTTTTAAAAITISPTQGIPGTAVTINGSNFDGQSTVYVYFNNMDTTLYPTTGDTGYFSTQYTVSEATPGTYTIRAEDQGGHAASATFQVQLELRAALSKNKGSVGDKNIVSGIGFKSNAPITIKYDEEVMTDAATTSDSSGSFETFFLIPASANGAHTITVSDGTNSKEFTFTMESNAPSVPSLLYPAVDEVLSSDIYFDWSDCTDGSSPSEPITYILQICSGPGFTESDVVINKENLEESRYALSVTEVAQLTAAATAASADTKFYWTVWSVDAADNKSNPATAGTFIVPAAAPTVPAATATPLSPTPTPTQTANGAGLAIFGSLPGWAVYALIALFAILIGIIGFWFGRKSAFM